MLRQALGLCRSRAKCRLLDAHIAFRAMTPTPGDAASTLILPFTPYHSIPTNRGTCSIKHAAV